MTVMSPTLFPKSAAMTTSAGDRRGARTAAYSTEPYATMTMMVIFLVYDQFKGSLGSSELRGVNYATTGMRRTILLQAHIRLRYQDDVCISTSATLQRRSCYCSFGNRESVLFLAEDDSRRHMGKVLVLDDTEETHRDGCTRTMLLKISEKVKE